jgi:acetoin utilization deacetylase AcuC-like enzyme
MLHCNNRIIHEANIVCQVLRCKKVTLGLKTAKSCRKLRANQWKMRLKSLNIQLSVDVFYSDVFVLPLPAGHRFPMDKYRLLRERVSAELPRVTLHLPGLATDGILALAHHPGYVEALTTGTLPNLAQRAIGFPWSLEMVERSRRSAGATIAAARSALTNGVAVNLAGGTHHAGFESGGGYCCFNDIAVAARLMQSERRITRALVIDLDVHQGNGTAQILRGDDSVFTFSMHGEKNYPFRKEISDLDIALPDGTEDEHYLASLDSGLEQLAQRCQPDMIFYLAGADVYKADRLGKLSLSKQGILERDRRVFEFAANAYNRQLPVAVCMGGGYCPVLSDIVDIHFSTVQCAVDYFEQVTTNPK